MVVSKSALAWGKRLDRFDRMDSTLAQFCRQEGVSQIAFYYWRRKLRGQPAASQRDQDSPLPHFLPVSLSPPKQVWTRVEPVRWRDCTKPGRNLVGT